MIVRPGVRKDIGTLHALMLEVARFDGTEHEFVITENELENALLGADAKLKAIILEVESEIIGFLNYFISYASFSLSPCIWVEDVFIKEDFRSKGYGNALFQFMKNEAKSYGCKNLEWLVRVNNKSGIQFYKKIGAKVDEGTIYVSWDI